MKETDYKKHHCLALYTALIENEHAVLMNQTKTASINIHFKPPTILYIFFYCFKVTFYAVQWLGSVTMQVIKIIAFIIEYL